MCVGILLGVIPDSDGDLSKGEASMDLWAMFFAGMFFGGVVILKLFPPGGGGHFVRLLAV